MVERLIVTVLVIPGAKVTLRVEKETVGTVVPDGKTDAVSDTIPAKPVLFKVSVVVVRDPADTPRLTGLLAKVKSPFTLRMILETWARLLFTVLIVTL